MDDRCTWNGDAKSYGVVWMCLTQDEGPVNTVIKLKVPYYVRALSSQGRLCCVVLVTVSNLIIFRISSILLHAY